MQRDRTFILLLVAAAASSLLAMALLPLADTSEPRYAEIARLMAESGDWITPWFSPGVPFWGKPPLSFWLQAASFRLLGVTEFAARLPSWIASALTLWIIHTGTRVCFDRATARLAVIIYATCALVFISSGAVLTDPFLALASTLCMLGWLMAERGAGWFWRHAFFIGLAIGLLAKGPLILVLAAGAIVPWLVINRKQAAGDMLKRQRWLSGTLLVLALVLPWYIAAEIKTPGFLDYFIIGEHVRRFIDPGWNGDLYGTAHQAGHGTIWYYWLQAAFPWWISAAMLLWAALRRAAGRQALNRALRAPRIRYFLAWALFTPLFFTFSGNILWTYVLPSLAGFSVLLALALQWQPGGHPEPHRRRLPLQMTALVAPAAVLVLLVLVTLQPNMLKTEKQLVSHALNAAPGTPLRFLDEVPFSARFYSRESAQAATLNDVDRLLERSRTVWLAVARDRAMHLPPHVAGTPVFESRRHVLYRLSSPSSPRLAAAQTGIRPPGIQ